MAVASKPAAKQANRPAPQQTKPAGQQAQSVNKPQAKPASPPPQTRVQSGDVDANAGRQQTKPNAVVERQSTAVAAASSTAVVPDYMRQGGEARGSENVSMQDLVIPRIELIQALSKCLEEGSAEYIEGAKAGWFFNSVTRELYGPSLIVCPVFFKKQFLNWRDRKKGGGFGGAHDSMAEAQARLDEQESPDEWEAVETAQQILLVVGTDPDTGEYKTSEAVLSLARTKHKVSRQWNSLIRMAGHDRFSRIYELFGVDETNTQNQTYKNIGVRMIDWASMPVYKAAETLYNSIASGERIVKVDDNYEDSVIDGESAPPGGQGGAEGSSEF